MEYEFIAVLTNVLERQSRIYLSELTTFPLPVQDPRIGGSRNSNGRRTSKLSRSSRNHLGITCILLIR